MAIFRADRNDVWYYGLAADAKPTDPTTTPKGAKFWETDTGVQYVFDGAAWVALDQPTSPA